ncbi:AI-2E family transporter [Reyranella sp.]|uniref:AI-2E family transporter n=1 Tax=Reyranella sp. TaxID=1929291 RepID=UPI003BAC967B
MDILTVDEERKDLLPVVRMHRGSAIRRPLILLAICAVAVVSYLARDFLIPTAAAVVLALMLTPVAKALERIHVPPTPAAGASVFLLTLMVAGLLAIAIPSISSWAAQAPYLTYTLERKLEGLRSSLAIVKRVSEQVEQVTNTPAGPAAKPPEKVVVRDKSLLAEIASTTPGVLIQLGYAGVLAFMLLAHRSNYKRQILRIPGNWGTRVRLARVMRDINDRVGHYLFTLAAIYSCVAVVSAIALALLGFPNAVMWGIVMGLASFVPFIGPPAAIGAVALVALLSFEDWVRIAAVPAVLVIIHFVESQLITPVFLSRRCALNTVAVFMSIALLGWMWGAVGAIVAVPLLILLSTIAAHLPSLHWLEIILGDDRPVSPRVARKPSLASVTRPPVRVRQPRRRRLATDRK